jgi:hypothetical protein
MPSTTAFLFPSLDFVMRDGFGLKPEGADSFDRRQALTAFIDGDETSNWVVSAGNDEVLAGLNPHQQLRQAGFGVGDFNCRGHNWISLEDAPT